MPAPFPHRYEIALDRTAPARATIAAPPRVALRGGPPPEFDGDPEVWSPEHLLLSALALCLYTTFEALAGRSQLAIASWQARASGVLDRTEAGLAFTSFAIDVSVGVAPADADRARTLVERAKRHCIVANALRAPVELSLRITPVAAAA